MGAAIDPPYPSARCQRLKPSAGRPNTLKRVIRGARETRFNGFCLSDAGFNPRRKMSAANNQCNLWIPLFLPSTDLLTY